MNVLGIQNQERRRRLRKCGFIRGYEVTESQKDRITGGLSAMLSVMLKDILSWCKNTDR